MKLFLLLLLALLVGCLSQEQTTTTKKKKKKNVLLIIVDDYRPEMGAYLADNNQYFKGIKTPNIDALAARSFLAKNAFVQQAVCSSSRASFLTGRRPETTKAFRVPNNFMKTGGNFTTLPQYFRYNGYTTAGYGKVFHAEDREIIDNLAWTEPIFSPSNKLKGIWGTKRSWVAANAEKRRKFPLMDELVASMAIEGFGNLSKTPSSQPFMMAVGFIKPHLSFTFPREMLDLYPLDSIHLPNNPYVPNGMPNMAWNSWGELREKSDIKKTGCAGVMNATLPDDIVRYLRRAYYSSVTYIDNQVGRVLEALREEGLEEDTIVALVGDHGFLLGEHGGWGKYTDFSLATRAPLMVSVPGLTDDGIISEEIVEFVDLFPTLVEAAGLGSLPLCPPDSKDAHLCIEGSSLMPLITNDTSVVWKDRAYSLFPRLPNETVMGMSMTTHKYRYTRWVAYDHTKGQPRWNKDWGKELYDLTKDPDENFNVYGHDDYIDVELVLWSQLKRGWRDALPEYKDGRNYTYTAKSVVQQEIDQLLFIADDSMFFSDIQFMNQVVFIALPLLGGIAGSFIARNNVNPWYEPVVLKQGWRPPIKAIGVVWTALYVGMGCASYLAYTDGGGFEGKAKVALSLYGIQLVLSWVWYPIFFGAYNFVLGSLIMAAVWGTAGATTYYLFAINTAAGLLNASLYVLVNPG